MNKKYDDSLGPNRAREWGTTGVHPIETQIALFLEYFKRLPKALQGELYPMLVYLSRQYSADRRLTAAIRDIVPSRPSPNAKNVLHALIGFLAIESLGSRLLHAFDRTFEQTVALQPASQSSSSNSPFSREPTLSFPGLNAIHPNFEIYYRMSKELSEHGLNQEKPEESEYYAIPRFIVRLEEKRNFQMAQDFKGNILYLTVEGHAMTVKNGIAVIDRNSIQWWQKKDESHTLLDDETTQASSTSPNLKLPSDKERDKKGTESYQKLTLQFKIAAHDTRITGVSLSYDELYLLTAGADGLIKLWCLRTQMQLTEYKAHLKTVWSVNFGPCGYFFVSAGADHLVKVWKTDTSIPIRIMNAHKADVVKADFLRNPDYVLSVSEDATARIWKVKTGEQLRELIFIAPLRNFTHSFSGRYLAFVEVTGHISIFDLLKGVRLNRFSITKRQIKQLSDDESNHPNGRSAKVANGIESKSDDNLFIHDLTFSEDDREFACVSSKFILQYSIDTLSEKISGNLFSVYGDPEQDSRHNRMAASQVIYVGRDSNLFYCKYHPRKYLIVGSTSKKY